MAAPIKPKTLAGVVQAPAELAVDPPATPPDPKVLQQQIQQLQNTVNELIVRHNALCDDTAHVPDKVTGTAQTAANLFTAS
jgi:hypothetical protein